MQPKWLQNGSRDGLPMALPIGKTTTKDDLLLLRKGGPLGIVMILIGLKWWASIHNKDKQWKLAVEDISACFGAFANGREKQALWQIIRARVKNRRQLH